MPTFDPWPALAALRGSVRRRHWGGCFCHAIVAEVKAEIAVTAKISVASRLLATW